MWKSKRLSDKSIKSPALSNDSLAVSLNYVNTKLQENWWKLFKARKIHIWSLRSGEYLHCLWDKFVDIYCW